MKTTLFRTFMVMAALLLVSFIILGSSFVTLAYQQNMEDKKATLENNADSLSALISSSQVLSGNILANSALRTVLVYTADFSGYHIVVANNNGNIVMTSDAEFYSSDLWISPEVMKNLQFDGSYTGTGNLGGLYVEEYFTVGKPIISASNKMVGAVFVSTSINNLRQMIAGFMRLFMFVASTVLIAACALAYVSAQRMASPLKLTAAAAREFARGNLSVRVNEDVPDQEIQELAVSFNNMAAALEKSEERRKEFIANISHELKTPMTSIGGYVDGILDGVIPEEKREDYLKIVSSEIKRLSRLVTEMLEVSRMETSEELAREIFDICEATRRVLIGQERRITEKNLDIDIDFEDSIEVIGEADSITRVIYNLLDNAVKYSYENTTIQISIKKNLGKATFSISDEGKPVDPAEREQMFERFHKIDRSRKSDGLGLGLYLVKSIMSRHNEDVWCECEGSVTKMSFTLPLNMDKPKKEIKARDIQHLE